MDLFAAINIHDDEVLAKISRTQIKVDLQYGGDRPYEDYLLYNMCIDINSFMPAFMKP